MISRHIILTTLLTLAVVLGCQRGTHPVEEEVGFVYTGFEDEGHFLQRYEQYLRSRDRYIDAVRLEAMVRTARFPLGYHSVKDSIDMREKAYHLAIDGLNTMYLRNMRRNGTDVFAMDWSRDRIGQAVTSEIVVRATVRDVFSDRDVGDDYRSTVVLQVHEVYKGILPLSPNQDAVAIRRKSGETETGRFVRDRSEVELEQGGTYLFFLSRGLYEVNYQFPDYTWLMRMDGTSAAWLDGPVLPDVPAGYVLERYPGLRLDWLPESRRERLLTELDSIDLN